MELAVVKLLKLLVEKKAHLIKFVAKAMLDKEALQVALSRKY